jgi:hypothetical protein
MRLWYKPSVSKKRITERPKVMDQKIFRRMKSWYTSSTATGSRDDHLVPPEYKLPTYYVVFIHNQQMLSSFIRLLKTNCAELIRLEVLVHYDERYVYLPNFFLHKTRLLWLFKKKMPEFGSKRRMKHKNDQKWHERICKSTLLRRILKVYNYIGIQARRVQGKPARMDRYLIPIVVKQISHLTDQNPWNNNGFNTENKCRNFKMM